MSFLKPSFRLCEFLQQHSPAVSHRKALWMTSAQWLPNKAQRLQNHLSIPKAKAPRACPLFPEVTASDPWLHYLERTINPTAFRIQNNLSQGGIHPWSVSLTGHPRQEEEQKVCWLDIKGPVPIQGLQLTQPQFSWASASSPENNATS